MHLRLFVHLHGGPGCSPFGQLWAVPTSWLIECQWTAETTLSCGDIDKGGQSLPYPFSPDGNCLYLLPLWCLAAACFYKILASEQSSFSKWSRHSAADRERIVWANAITQVRHFCIAALSPPPLPSLSPSLPLLQSRLAYEFSSDSQARPCSLDATKVALPDINSTIVLAWKLENKFKLNYPILVILLTIKNLLKEKAAYIKHLICCMAICMPLPAY